MTLFDTAKYFFLTKKILPQRKNFYICVMTKKKKKYDPYKSIKIKREAYGLVFQHKEATGVSIGHFIEQAIEEKLQKDKIVKA